MSQKRNQSINKMRKTCLSLVQTLASNGLFSEIRLIITGLIMLSVSSVIATTNLKHRNRIFNKAK